MQEGNSMQSSRASPMEAAHRCGCSTCKALLANVLAGADANCRRVDVQERSGETERK